MAKRRPNGIRYEAMLRTLDAMGDVVSDHAERIRSHWAYLRAIMNAVAFQRTKLTELTRRMEALEDLLHRSDA